MSPYLEAYGLYDLCDRGETWTEAMEVHLQHGAVISTAGGFVMARRVFARRTDAEHVDLAVMDACGDCWHVWAAAGNLSWLLGLAHETGLEWVSYQRRGEERVRRRRIAQLFNAANGRGVRSVGA